MGKGLKVIRTLAERVLASNSDICKQKERSLFLGFLFGFGSLVPNILAMILANSVTLQSNVLRSSSETLAIFFSWLTVRRVAQGITHRYNYGYGKLENLASLIIAAVMILSLVVIFGNAVGRFRRPIVIGGLGAGMGLLFAGLAGSANAWYWVRLQGMAEKQSSAIMESQWRLFRARTVANLGVISSLGLSLTLRKYSWVVYVDPVGSIILAGFLLFSAYGIISMSVYDLLDRTLEESLQMIILQELTGYFDEYVALHGIRSRRSGSSVYIEIFLEFDGERKMADVQRVIDSMKDRLEQRVPGSQVVISPVTSPVT